MLPLMSTATIRPVDKIVGHEWLAGRLPLSDRILVIYEGRIVGEFPPTATEEELGLAMTGGGRGEEAA